MPVKGARGGRGKCAACEHQAHDQIDADLAAGVLSPGAIAKKYGGLSRPGLINHKAAHLNPAIVALTVDRKREEREAVGEQTLREELREIIERCKGLLDVAESAGNVTQALAAVRELRATLELLAKITGELDERPVTTINLLATTEWTQLRDLINLALASHPAAALALADHLERAGY